MGFRIDQYSPRNVEEWWEDMRAGVRAAAEVATDAAKGVGDAAWSLITFPHHAVSYITGTDCSFGEGNPIFSSKFGRCYRQSDWVGIVAENPLYRMTDVAAQMVYGGVDLVTNHLPYTVFNDELEMEIKYFSPPAETVREGARDLLMVAVIAVTPIVKGRVMREPVVRPAPMEEIKPPVQLNQATPFPADSMPPAFGLLVTFPRLVQMGRWVSDTVAQINPFSKFNNLKRMALREERVDWGDPTNQRLLSNPRLSAVLLQRLIESAKGNDTTVRVLCDLARARPEFASQIIDGLLQSAESRVVQTSLALRDFIEARPEFFSAHHIQRLIEVVKAVMNPENGVNALSRLAQARPEFAPEIIQSLVGEMWGGNAYAPYALGRLALKRPELIPQIIPLLLNAVDRVGEARGALVSIAKARPELAPQIIDRLLGRSETAAGLGALAKERPEFAPQIIPRLIQSAADWRHSAGDQLTNLAMERPELFSAGEIPGLIESLRRNREIMRVLNQLAMTRPEIFSVGHIRPLEESARPHFFGTTRANPVLDALAKTRPDLFPAQ